MNPIRTALVGGLAAAYSGHIAHAATASAPRLADFSLGEVIAPIGTFALVATGVSIAAGAAIGYIRDRARVRRDRLAAEFDQMAIAAGRAAISMDRRRSVETVDMAAPGKDESRCVHLKDGLVVRFFDPATQQEARS